MYFDVYCDSGVKQKIRTSISHLFCEYFSISLNHHFTKQIKGFQTYQDKGKYQLER
jgi:hypothetical protein